jgi:hypothetical protein
LIKVDLDAKRLEVDGVELGVSSIEPSPTGYAWNATVRLQRDLVLDVRWSDGDDHVVVEAWRGRRNESEGVGVIGDSHGPVGLSAIPVCGCGEYGCSASGRKFRVLMTLADLAEVCQVLRRLPWVTTGVTPENRWEPTESDGS